MFARLIPYLEFYNRLLFAYFGSVKTKWKDFQMNYDESKKLPPIPDDFQSILNDLKLKEGDELVQEFIRIFTSRTPTDIEHLIEFRKSENYVNLKQKVHFLSTTLVTLKFDYGLSLANKIEKAIDAKRNHEVLDLTDEFIEYLLDALIEIS
jgi:HPt (histidine-containing phosphotransfer) domain-containing protein